ncbi:hypothetical protein AF335_04630 [Streptomyces eurocidicus]|uniref:Uncharacterized protein YukE n=1 Tax=Streptomyces eurocidicus TaxID=66423 RepID=A0A2N8P3L2_STREU|nr:hypothetical protein [Streptomyces eurocidicus]MBB5117813.1 uncharacterized protein YukE [Streptomyces eurocidicus]MBF6055638.1 hypothetical protein [Streptomyces eurocidicus]PNE35596.1 hypothetical protein AF335_04630 [Streptomyces eurocidicus]
MADQTPDKSAADPRRMFNFAFITQDFYVIPHEKLHTMIEHADVSKVNAVSSKLHGAAKAIKQLGEDLQGHMDEVKWSGQAGESFRIWGQKLALETKRLGEYASTAGTWMAHAATDLNHATNMPKPSAADKALVDSWVKEHPYVFGGVPNPMIKLVDKVLNQGGTNQKDAYDAQKRIADDHHDAASRMKKLAESYQSSSLQMYAAKRPNFPPMPDALMPEEGARRGGLEDVDVSGGSGGPSSGGGAGAGPSGYGPGASSGGGPGISGPSGSHDRPHSRPDLDLSGVVDTPPRPRTPRPDLPPVTPPDASRPHVPGPPAPLPNWPGPNRRHDPVPRPGDRLPDQGRRPAPRIPGPGLPGPGSVQRPDTRLPGPNTGPVPRPGSRLSNPPSDGIVGGQPAPRGGTPGPTQNPGRSNVFGAEPAQRQGQSRAPMGPVGAGGGFPGVSGPSGGRPGTGAGRHMATDPGGVVGGRPGQRPGGGGTPFTPGGTGLVRGAGEGTGTAARNGMPAGMMPGAGLGGASPERRGGGGRRPDYLVEDEETWAQSKPVVPPVIE